MFGGDGLMAAPAARVCRSCPTVLSAYNTGTRCGPCEVATRDSLPLDLPAWDQPERPPRAISVQRARRRHARALPNGGYRRIVAYLEELRARLVQRDGESDDTRAVTHVIAIMEREALIR